MELLRIVSIFMIIVFHCVLKSGFSFQPGFSMNKLIIKCFWMLGEMGVNLFILISGYYMVNSQFKWKKLILLLAEVQFYTWVTIWLGIKLGIYALSDLKSIFLAFFPVTLDLYWFITAYILVYILSPFFNLLIHTMDKKTYRKFLAVVLCLYSAIPTIFGIFFNSTEGLLYYNRMIWLAIMYFVGAYIRLYVEVEGEKRKENSKKYVGWVLLAAAVMVSSILLIDHFNNFFAMLGTIEPAYFWSPNTLPMVLLSIGVFGLFRGLSIPYQPVINKLASTTLGIYLLHDGVLVPWLWNGVFHCAEYQDSPYLVFHILLAATVIFTVGALVDLLRQILEKYTLDRLLQFNIHTKLFWTGEKDTSDMQKNSRSHTSPKHMRFTVFRFVIRILMGFSFAVLAVYQMLIYEPRYVICTLGLAGIIGYVFVKKTEDETLEYLKTHFFQSGIILLFVLFIIRAIHLEKNHALTDVVLFPTSSGGIRFFRFRVLILALPAIFYLLSWAWRKLANFISDLWRQMDQTEKRLYLGFSILFSILILIGYAVEPQWFMQYDGVHSIDSGWAYSEMFSKFSYYDIRHPVIHMIIFPIWAIMHTPLQWIVPSQLLDILCASFIQMINLQALLLTGMMIQKLSGDRWTFVLYSISFSVLEFVMFFEKYQIIAFFLVLYVYQLCRKREHAEASIIIATGTMPTNLFLGSANFVLKKPVQQVLYDLFKSFILGIAVVICAGRIYLLNPQTISDANQMMATFGKKGFSIDACLFSFTKMIHGIILPLSAQKDWAYIWTDILDTPSIIGIVVLTVAILGFFVTAEDSFSKICFLWLGFSIVLICIVQWSVHESPLFSILFTWAVIPLFQKGFSFIIKKCHWNQYVAYGVLIIPILAINIASMIDIWKFLALI